MERVTINNYVVRFFSSVEEAADTAKVLGLNIYQHDNANQYLVADDLSLEVPEIIDASGMIFSKRSIQSSDTIKLWIKELSSNLVKI
tara:strand:+ start:220 stop:480 length:261 start_codon:yes stop_codon:yes gene_type:complete